MNIIKFHIFVFGLPSFLKTSDQGTWVAQSSVDF